MAKGYYQSLYDDLFKGSHKIATKPKTQEQKVSAQLENKKTRLKSGGVDVDKETDSRNFVEKLFNVDEDQNFLFDIFEVLGRPQQALFGAWKENQDGGDLGDSLKAAWEHFKGNEETQFKEILKDNRLGIDFKDRKGKLDLVDALGFAGDVFLDPADWAVIAAAPATGGTSLVGLGANAKDVAKVASAANDASKAVDAGKIVAKAGDAAQIASKADNVVKAGKKAKSLSDLAFEGMGKAIKGGAKLTDNAIESLLKKSDELAGITYKAADAKSAANLGKVVAEGVDKNTIGALEIYKDIKDTTSRLFNTASNIPKKVLNAVRKNDADSIRAANELSVLRKQLDDDILSAAESISARTGENVKDVVKRIDKDVYDFKELRNLNRETTVKGLIDEALDGTLTFDSIGEDGIKTIKNVAEDVNKADRGLKLTVDVIDGKVKLNDDWNKIHRTSSKNLANIRKKYGDDFANQISSLNLDEAKLNQTFTKKGTPEAEKRLKELQKQFNEGKDKDILNDLYNKVDGIFNKANEIVNKHFDTALPTANNSGYVRHAFNKENFDKYKQLGFKPDSDFIIKGNTMILGDRKYNMSTIEANKMFSDTILKNIDELSVEEAEVVKKIAEGGLFKEGMTASLDSYLENIPKLAKDSKNIDNVLIKTSFGNLEELNSIEKALKSADDPAEIARLQAKRVEALNNSSLKVLTNKDPNVPRGFTKLNSHDVYNLSEKLRRLGDELGNSTLREYSSVVKNIGEDLAINTDVLRLIEINTDKKAINGYIRLYDSFLNFFKRNKVLSPTFQMNNIVGNSSNMLLGGIGPTKQAVLLPQAVEIIGKKDDLMSKVARFGVEALTPDEAEMYEIWSKFMDAGFGDVGRLSSAQLADMPESLRKYFREGVKPKGFKWVKDGLPYLNLQMNEYTDTMFRLATFIEGSRNPKFLRNIGVDNAGEAVRKILFDPSDLTSFERNVMKRAIPFYTFTKKNLAFQIENLSKNGANYHKLFKAQDSALKSITGDNEENIQEWLKNNMYIPVPYIGEDGSYRVMRATLPFGALVELADDPLSSVVSSSTPFAKLPFELVTNKNAFTGADLEKFPGQKSANIPFLTKKQEHTIGALTGLDVPVKNAVRAYNGVADTMRNGGTFMEGLGNAGLNVTTLEGNVNTDRLNKMYRDLDELETIMQQYQQAGYEFSTINELKKANKNSTAYNINAKLNRYSGLKKNPYLSQLR